MKKKHAYRDSDIGHKILQKMFKKMNIDLFERPSPKYKNGAKLTCGRS